MFNFWGTSFTFLLCTIAYWMRLMSTFSSEGRKTFWCFWRTHFLKIGRLRLRKIFASLLEIVVLMRIWEDNNNPRFFHGELLYTLPSFWTWKVDSHMVMFTPILMTFKAAGPMKDLYFAGPLTECFYNI